MLFYKKVCLLSIAAGVTFIAMLYRGLYCLVQSSIGEFFSAQRLKGSSESFKSTWKLKKIAFAKIQELTYFRILRKIYCYNYLVLP